MAKQRTERSFVDELPGLLVERGLSLRALARQAHVSQSHLSHLLGRVGYRSRPSADLARRIALALGLPPDYFREYREAVVIDEIRKNVAFREKLYDSIAKSVAARDESDWGPDEGDARPPPS